MNLHVPTVATSGTKSLEPVIPCSDPPSDTSKQPHKTYGDVDIMYKMFV